MALPRRCRSRPFDDTFIPWVAGEPLPARDSGGKKPPGRHPHNKLTALTMRQLGPGRHADGEGLYLFVRKSGACQWVQRIDDTNKRIDLVNGRIDLVYQELVQNRS